MKKLFVLFLSFIAFALLTVSCSKDRLENTPRPVTSNSATQNARMSTDYDYSGELHNKGLDYFLEHANFEDARAQAEPVTLEFLESQGFDSGSLKERLHDPLVSAVVHSESPDEVLREYYAAHGMDRELHYFDQIRDALTGAPDADVAVEKLRAIENQLKVDDGLSNESRSSLLRGLAVGRYSAKYWYTQYQLGNESPWAIKTGTGLGKGATALKAKPWWAIGLADLVGTVVSGGVDVVGGICASILYGLP